MPFTALQPAAIGFFLFFAIEVTGLVMPFTALQLMESMMMSCKTLSLQD